jgi:hypothetical protein
LPSSTHLAVIEVTSLEPRTPHQPGKLQNVSKNDYGFTISVFCVNQIWGEISAWESIECTASTGR